MAIALWDVGRLPPGPRRDFAEALHDLYDQAGQPAARVITRAIFKRPRAELETVSHETVSSTLRGVVVPAWPKVQAIVTVLTAMSVQELALDVEIARLHRLWLTARSAPEPVPVTAAAQPPPPSSPPPSSPPPPSPSPPSPTASEGYRPDEQIIGPLPERNADFIGRELLLDTMREYHLARPNVPLVLYGVGGVGKTQLAREYVHRYARQYAVVWWVPAEPAEAARTALVMLAERLGLPLRPGTDQTVNGVLNELESRGVRFLLVFDGAEGDSIRRMIPSIGGNVLVTTRDSTWAADSANSRLEVLDFDEGEAIQFLRKRDAEMSGTQATEVIDQLGRLPLALEQLAALRLASDRTWADLLRLLDEPDHRLLVDAAEPAHYPHTVAANLQLAVDQLRRANPNAVLIFELFAWFGSEPVSVPLLRRGAGVNVSPELQRTLSDSFVLSRVAADISRYGLARLHPQEQRIEVQPMMRLALRDTMSAEDGVRAQRNVHAILTAADLGPPDEVMWDLHKAMAPHVLPSGLVNSRLPEAHRAVYHQVRYRYLLGDFEGARRLGEAAVTVWQDPGFLGPDAEMVLLTKREWANALRGLGQYHPARLLNEECLPRLIAAYGESHPQTLGTARGYAADLRTDGEYQAALSLDQTTYRHLIRQNSAADDRAAVAHHNMAVSYRLLGLFSRAEEIDREEFERRHTLRGPDDRRTRLSLNALAEDLFGLGRFREMLELEKAFGGTAEGTSRTLGHVLAGRTFGLARRRLGDYGGALERLQAHVTECVSSYGQDHGFTLAAMMSYANVLRERQILGLAYSTALDAIGGYERAFGSGNPLTLAAQVNLAAVLRCRQERRLARRTDEVAREKLAAKLGPEHPFSIVAGINLASDLATTGDLAAARALAVTSYELSRELHGALHFTSLIAAANLAIVKPDAGLSRDDVLAGLRRCVGGDHPTVRDVALGRLVECDLEPPSL